MAGIIMAAAGWLALFVVYLRSSPGTFYFEDAPELIACAGTLGNTHGPGYPLLVMAGKLAMLAPLGSPAFRFNIFGAACAAGAAAGLGALTTILASRFAAKDAAILAGAFAAVAWGLSDTFWWQAAIGDKYPAFYLAFVILAWTGYALASSDGIALRRWLLLGGMVCGLAAAHHAFSIFLMAIPVLAIGRQLRSGRLFLGSILGRALLVAAVFIGIGLSCKVVYPPIRSSAGIAMDWERTDRFHKLVSYLSAGRYFIKEGGEGARAADIGWKKRIAAQAKAIAGEFPLLLIAIAPLGAVKIARAVGGLVPGLTIAAISVFAFMLQFPERVSRWQEPAYAIILFFAAGGLAEMAASFSWVGWRRLGAFAGAVVVILTGVWQWNKGIARNDLSRFYAAHDLGRNILVSLPRNSIYLGRGDTDLFPLWEMIFLEGARPDVVAAGLGSVIDVNPAGVGALEIALGRAGLVRPCWASLYALVRGEKGKPPVFIAKTGYDPALWERLGNLAVHQGRGIVGRLAPDWRFDESFEKTQRLFRRYSLRGVVYAKCGASFDAVCPRDEIALSGLMIYADSLLSFGIQSYHYGPSETALEAYRASGKLLEPFVGRLTRAPDIPGLGEKNEARLWAWALGDGYDRLAVRFRKCGAAARAEIYRRTAEMCRL